MDSGAGASFVSGRIIRRHGLSSIPLKEPLKLTTFNGESTSCSYMSEPLSIITNGISFEQNMYILPDLAYDIILGLDWLIKINPIIDWPSQEMREHRLTNEQPGSKTTPILSIEVDTRSRSAPPSGLEPGDLVTTLYSEFQDGFSKANADLLPEHRFYDCSIDLKPDLTPPFRPIYQLPLSEGAARIYRR